MAYSIIQNTTFLTAASILQKVISFVYFTVIARLIGVESTGSYFFAISFTTIFTVVADFGLNPTLTREISKYPENTEKFFNTVFTNKILFGFVSYGLVVLFANLLQYDVGLKHLIYLSGFSMFFDNIQSCFYAVFRARKNLIYESIGVVSSQALTLVIGTIALFNHWPLYWLILAYTIPSFLNGIFASISLRRVYNLAYHFVWDKVIGKAFLRLAAPFAIAGLMNRLYSYSDSIFISKLLTKEHLGWWSVPYKITFAFQFVPVALGASVYPVMSALSVASPDKISSLFERAWKYLFMLVMPVSFGLYALAEPVILHLYGHAYAPAIPVLRILLVGLIFGYLSFITGSLLNATNHQRTQTGLITVAWIVNVALNLLLIGRFNIIGSAIASLVGSILLCLGGYYFSSRAVRIDHKKIFVVLTQVLIPAVVMGGLAYVLSWYMHYTIVIVLSAFVYGALLFVTRALTVGMVKQSLAKVFPKKFSI